MPACSLAGFTKRKTAIVIISDTCVFPAVTSKKKKKKRPESANKPD